MTMDEFERRYQKRIDEALSDEVAAKLYNSVKELTEDSEWTSIDEVKEHSGVENGFEAGMRKLSRARLVKRTYHKTPDFEETALYKPIPVLEMEGKE